VAGRVVALKGAAKRFVALAAPDGRDRLLEYVAQDALFFVLARASMAEGCETTGEYVAAYAQILPGGRQFRFCEQHVPLNIKKQADAAEAANANKKS
jgi:hypothetical protein